MDSTRSNLGLLLRSARQRRDLFQADVARLADVSQPFVSRLERGDLDLSVLISCLRVVRALDLSIDAVERALGMDQPEKQSLAPVRRPETRPAAVSLRAPLFGGPLLPNGKLKQA